MTEYLSLVSELGWPLDHLSVIDAYRDSGARYHFVSMTEVQHLFCKTGAGEFELLRADFPSYDMGRQCPTLLFRRAGRVAVEAADA